VYIYASLVQKGLIVKDMKKFSIDIDTTREGKWAIAYFM